MKFYFAYGLADDQDFKGGWTEVEADDLDMAISLFDLFHPRNKGGFVNCGGIYSADAFERTFMFREGNFGSFCHEKIKVERETVTQ